MSSGASPEQAARVSVVVPCYRSAATIGRAITSVAQQSVPAFEVIVVDDCSGDETVRELRALSASVRGGWLRIIELDRNAGPSTARNLGWDAARGDLVAFLDADDAWHPQKLEIQTRFMVEHPEVALCGHLFSCGAGNMQVSDSPPAVEISAQQLLWSNRFVTPSVMVRRELPFRFRIEQRFMEDHALWLEIAYAGYPVMRLEAKLAILFKPVFETSGQSSNLIAMEKAELENYGELKRVGRIGVVLYVVLFACSMAKFLRRLLIVALRRSLATFR